MPQFMLNTPTRASLYDALDTFTKGYIEAMFFTNCDSGDDDEHKANRLGVQRLTRESIVTIADECKRFWQANETDLQAAMELEPGSESFRYAKEELDETRLGHFFWYARQGHGVGFDDDGDSPILERLQEAGRNFGESYPEIYNGWIYVR